MTADKAQLKTQGGDISLGRLVGQQCVLDARPADTASGESSTSGRYCKRSRALATEQIGFL